MKSFLKNLLISLLTILARLAIFIHKPIIIAITGSVGKTSTKDAIASVVSETYCTRKSQKSENSEIGIPITILGLKNAWANPLGWVVNLCKGLYVALLENNFPKLLVLEIGADHPGDIEKVSKWLKSDAVVFTRMSDVPVHVEYFDSPQDVFKEKSLLVRTLKTQGILVLNHDDALILSLKDTYKSKKVITFGAGVGADVRLTKDNFLYENIEGKQFPKGFEYTIKTSVGIVSGSVVGALGKQQIYPILSSVAVGLALHISIGDIEKTLKTHQSPKGRMKLLKGINNSTIIDDTYNSSPIALYEALATLSLLDIHGKKIAVLGDMRELGGFSETEHVKGGRLAAKSADFLICVGRNVLLFVKGALESGMNRNCIFTFETADEAGIKLKELLTPGDVVLIKGSQGVRMEKTVMHVLVQPEEAENLLVRQEEEWKKR